MSYWFVPYVSGKVLPHAAIPVAPDYVLGPAPTHTLGVVRPDQFGGSIIVEADDSEAALHLAEVAISKENL